jgi:hypothetical protein
MWQQSSGRKNVIPRLGRPTSLGLHYSIIAMGTCPLLGVKRKSSGFGEMSAYDLKRTLRGASTSLI